ncbi:mCG147742 [Mus musculus]|nr:mCG147742 [Mus musculus]
MHWGHGTCTGVRGACTGVRGTCTGVRGTCTGVMAHVLGWWHMYWGQEHTALKRSAISLMWEVGDFSLLAPFLLYFSWESVQHAALRSGSTVQWPATVLDCPQSELHVPLWI